MPDEYIEELNLYYVATTRGRYKVQDKNGIFDILKNLNRQQFNNILKESIFSLCSIEFDNFIKYKLHRSFKEKINFDCKGYFKILNDVIENDDIKKAFRKLSKVYHPDKNLNDKLAEETFKKLNEAYINLKTKQLREVYIALCLNSKLD